MTKHLLAACVFCLILVTASLAGPVTFSYSGQVDQVFRAPPAPFETVQVGDDIRVDYVLELDTPDQDPIADTGTFSGAVIEYEVTIGDASVSTTFGGVNTLNAGAFGPQDTYAAVGLFDDFSASVSFQDPDGAALAEGDDLQSIDLGSFPEPSFLLLNGIFPAVTGSLSPTEVVPEPFGFNMLAVPFLVAFLARRSRRR